jgi:hypothetical protein
MRPCNKNEDNLIIHARWNRETAARGSMVRMEWEAKNCSDNTLIVDGYRVKWYEPKELKGIDSWPKELDMNSEMNQNYISNPHVITILWPEESRSYYWAHVSTEHYPLKKLGQWGYRVIFKYHKDNSSVFEYASSNIAKITITQGTIPIRAKSFIESHKEYLSELIRLTPETDIRYDVRLSHIGIIDALVEGPDSTLIIELKFDRFKDITLNQMRQYLIWASEQRKQKESTGLILVNHDDFNYILESNIKIPKGCSLFVGMIHGNRLHLRRVSGQP